MGKTLLLIGSCLLVYTSVDNNSKEKRRKTETQQKNESECIPRSFRLSLCFAY